MASMRTNEQCSCVPPYFYISSCLTSKERQGLEILHQREGLITAAECKRIGSSYYRDRCIAVARTIPSKSVDDTWKICEISEEHQLLHEYGKNLIKVFMDVYHKEQLVTREEAERPTTESDEYGFGLEWLKLAVSKDGDTAARIADILNKYGFYDVARHIRVLVDVYHKEQLVTREEAGEVAARIWSWTKTWVEVVVTKDGDTAARIGDILDKYGFHDDAAHIRFLLDVYHKEQLVTKEEAKENAAYEWGWEIVAVTKDGDTAARIADILVKYGFNDVAQHIRVLVDVYHKEQLVTKEEAEEVVATDKSQRESKWAEVTVTKYVDTAARMADILDTYGFNDSAQHIRVFVAVYHKEQLVTSEEAEMVASTTDEASWMWVEIAFSKDVDTAARIADILDEYGFNDDAAHIRVLVDVYHKEQLVTKEEAEDVASIALRWEDIAATKDGDTIARIVDIFDKYGLNEFAHEFIRGSSK